MKLVTAIIQPNRTEDVKVNLEKAGVHGITVSDVRGFGRQKGHTEIYRGAEYKVDFIPKTRIEVVCDDQDAGVVASIILNAAASGNIGDGKIWITHVEELVRIRTGERGAAAI
ncbi:MAG: P-II family nitrogen regulator [Candidatus Ancillula sp.]|jgi:nitrogen regulatory protein P-II 1|nr:P-II family nitrogen regulator [Candidatus Ancillula sp.]